uniref:Reverse transcriptase domain-containing protein n=1 Tax=Astyanax mexicanus TaxID=7994 RepID=A0A3B1IK57_ASTMX
MLQNMPVTLVCLYAPNWDDDGFFTKLFTNLPNADTHHLIIGGDFNLVQDVFLDRSSSKPISLSKSASVLRGLAAQFGLTDPWRSKYPKSRAFSFFSHAHHSFSRIDFFLLDNRIMHLVGSCDYQAISLSDHAPVTTLISFPLNKSSPKQWRFTSHMLADSDFKKMISTLISFYFSVNDTPDTGSGSLWEAFKAFMRGQIISQVSFTRKMDRAKVDRLLEELKQLDLAYASSPSSALYTKRCQLHLEYELLMTDRIVRQLRQTKQRFFEQGDKAGRLLAQQARATCASRFIPRIKLPSGDLTLDPFKINKTFLDYYSELYTSEHSSDTPSYLHMPESLTYPKISTDIAKDLGQPISPSEVQNAIDSLKNGKSPGPDGFTAEFYKTFATQLVPFLTRVYNDAFKSGKLPQSLTSASISLLLKKDKDPTLCSSYRPISLLNVDFKILSKILAQRLQKVMPILITTDQTGFISGRHSFFNTRRLFNILYSPPSNTPEIVVSLDAEKAFDRVEWDHLFATLERFGFDTDFIKWVQLLYTEPTASVQTNGINSSPFLLNRGTRQGCPLSPLLFNLAIEPLAIWLRSLSQFKGIIRYGLEHKLSLYADDLLLYISDPSTSLPPVLETLAQFGRISGYKLNLQKSEVILVNPLAKSLPHSLFPFKVSERFRYLGVFFTSSIGSLFAHNFSPLLEKCKADMARWATLPLSAVGRINLIKMVTLPRFLYLFQHIPVFIKKSFFTNFDSQLNSFIWNNKPPRIKRSILQLPKSEGGLALPNFRHYYWASNLLKILYWINPGPLESRPPWVHTETASAQFSLHAVLCSQLPIFPYKISQSPAVTASVRIWSQFRRQFGLQRASIHMPILNNYLFIPACSDPTFRKWVDNGLSTIKDLYTQDVFSSFSDLAAKYNSFIDKILSRNPTDKHLISDIYDLINSLCDDPNLNSKQSWERDLGITISEDEWTAALGQVHSSSICARHGLMQCKVLHKAHYTNARLAKIFPDRSDVCEKCGHFYFILFYF